MGASKTALDVKDGSRGRFHGDASQSGLYWYHRCLGLKYEGFLEDASKSASHRIQLTSRAFETTDASVRCTAKEFQPQWNGLQLNTPHQGIHCNALKKNTCWEEFKIQRAGETRRMRDAFVQVCDICITLSAFDSKEFEYSVQCKVLCSTECTVQCHCLVHSA